MRFFAHDGKSTHGPAGIEELLKLPGFDGDTLVCPVGSNDTADWKPALAYAPFKKALLDAPAPAPALPKPAPLPLPKASPPPPAALSPLAPPVPSPFPLPSMPIMPPLVPKLEPPAPLPVLPAPKTTPCPGCAHPNLEEARFCNACGARMAVPVESLTPPPSAVAPAPAPEPAAEPAFDPFAPSDPMLNYSAAPAAFPESPRRPLQPGKMGQLAELEDIAPAASFASPSPEIESAPAAASAPPPAAEPVPVWKRPVVLAAVAGAALAAAGLAYVMLGPSAPVETLAELTPSAPATLEAPPPAPVEAPVYSTPPEPSSLPPAIPAPKARKRAPRPARAAVAEPPAAEGGGGDTFIESRAPEPKPKPKGKRTAKARAEQDAKDPLLEALLADAAQTGSEAVSEPGVESAEKAPPAIGQRPAEAPGQFSLPGLKRPVSASDRRAPQARAARPADEEIAAAPDSGGDAGLAEPGNSPPPPGIEDEPVKTEGDQLALVQVHEQFDFCAQLLAQGAYGDHFDTCLCKDTREASPYRGRRGYYTSAKKKEAGGGRLETSAKILTSKLNGGVATVKARWKASSGDKGRDATQTWKLEDGLWCQAP